EGGQRGEVFFYKQKTAYEMEQRPRSGRRQPAEVDGEEEDHDEPHPERRHREAEQREDLADAVPPLVDTDRGDDPSRDADDQRECHRRPGQQQRGRQARQVELEDVRAVVEGLPEVAADEMGDEARVLHPEWPIEAELLSNRGEVRGAGAGLGEEHGGISGDAHQKEDCYREEKERDERQPKPLDDELLHRVLTLTSWSS